MRPSSPVVSKYFGFWAIVVKPGEPQTLHHPHDAGTLRIRKANLGRGNSKDRTTVQCIVGTGNPISLCTLVPDVCHSFPLHLEFEEANPVTFSVLGRRSIILSGYFVGASSVYDATPPETVSYNVEAFSDTDDSAYTSFRPYLKSQYSFEDDDETDDENPASVDANHHDSGNGNLEAQLQIDVTNGISGVPETEDNDEFTVSFTSRNKDIKLSADNTGPDDNLDEDRKRKISDLSPDREPATESCQPLDASTQSKSEYVDGQNTDMKIRTEDTKSEGNVKGETSKLGALNGALNIKKGYQDVPSEAGSHTMIRESQKLDENTVALKLPKDKPNEQDVVRRRRRRSLPNQLVIEDLSLGKPGAKRADVGSKVFVHYTAKLKHHWRVFDRTKRGKPFSFRLGQGEVIKGFDIGLEGMCVGDRRKLTIPPSLGQRNRRNVLRPHTMLVYEVELVDVE